MRIPAGWPKRPVATVSPPPDPEDDGIIVQLDNLMSDTEFREKLYRYTLEMWDLDIEYFRMWLMSTDGDDMWDVKPSELEEVILECVYHGSTYFT